MATITAGNEAVDGASSFDSTNNTFLELGTPANGTGSITVFELYIYASATAVKVGTFSDDGANYYTLQDYESLGSVSSGSKQTFSGLSCDVTDGDVLGVKMASGTMEAIASVGSGRFAALDGFSNYNSVEYPTASTRKVSLYATGETAAVGWTTAKLNGIASASIVKVNGITVASVKKVGGVAVQ